MKCPEGRRGTFPYYLEARQVQAGTHNAVYTNIHGSPGSTSKANRLYKQRKYKYKYMTALALLSALNRLHNCRQKAWEKENTDTELRFTDIRNKGEILNTILHILFCNWGGRAKRKGIKNPLHNGKSGGRGDFQVDFWCYPSFSS